MITDFSGNIEGVRTMPKTLTLSKPELFTHYGKVYSVKWELLDEEGEGYRISWIEGAFDTNRPECIAFPYKHKKRGIQWTNYHEQAGSHNPDAALALRDVMEQLKEKHGYTYNTEVEIQLLPGEVVADD